MRRVLLIAFHFPPFGVGSGLRRTLKFAQYLPDYGWEATVLTVTPGAYPSVSERGAEEIPPGLDVRRALGLDAARHFAIGGRYPSRLALPDRWASWALTAVPYGWWLARRLQPDVIFSTYPIATAHRIGLKLKQLTGLPWVADFRDSMMDEHFPVGETLRSRFAELEQRVVAASDAMLFTSPAAISLYRDRYPDIDAGRYTLIRNGYDEEDFQLAEREASISLKDNADQLVLVHSGVLYPEERNPVWFLDALAALKRAGTVTADGLKVVLRASGSDELYRRQAAERDVADIVAFEPPMPYFNALNETLHADGLLIFQSASCNHQIPAKAYEYLRARKPVFSLTDAAGDTARLLVGEGLDAVVPLDDPERIAAGLECFIADLRAGRTSLPSDEAVAAHSRHALTGRLAEVLHRVSTA
ncbi:MAG: glycosyltransferase [Gammaproteobacteria bacterium]|nr:glycosyltransferase [Gammaproteobacteria bacterium]